MVIRSYRSRHAESLYKKLAPAKPHRGIAKQAIRRLQQLDAATSLQDLKLPGNRLERLSGDRKGEYSIRINDKWRICFRWEDGDAHDVEIVDYH